jgi:hypothetical protein
MYRRLHRILGIIMLLPFLGWAATGLVFFLKPGYEGAYEVLSPKTYPLDESLSIHPDSSWLEFRCFRTVLGDHLIVRTADGWRHLNPRDLRPRSLPLEAEIRRLLTDAISTNPARYGKIVSLSGNTARTDTGVEITVDWTSLSLQQKGKDTERINRLYKIHYLQWTGIQSIDRVVAILGIVLVIVLTLLGARLAIRA